MTLSAGVSEASDPAFGFLGGPEPAQAQRAEPVRVAHAEEALRFISTSEKAPSRSAAPLQGAGARSSVSGNELASSSATTSLSVPRIPGSMPDLLGQGGGVGEVAVVAEREAGTADRR